ncbi:M15 family metallopeptidase [Rickettsiales endosymbiont of Stachyamoeba lipophora]|uniref:M15 family metallopeptidase n=1 Tax=Rickettsiales endosymbiont of Stachyamoeba lipophora TaxID=2486578 RepID=UPI000F652EC5|nr:M15 family metallopeptidase [Rickettsiales endosymbiont of Stachyamoeba lipophora]AZL16400.1 D-alanyl-D-alanine dipeptidase [Rickettsiales endosymbiont of Stachyamoeba lipophora]
MTERNKNEAIILIADPRILAIEIKDNQEEMLDLTLQTAIIYGSSPEIPNNNDYTKLRKTVYERLRQAQSLLPQGFKFCLYEGYRSIKLQKKLFDMRFAKIAYLHPDWPEEMIFDETIKMVSPVVNKDKSLNIPPHSTGAAFDVYLLNDKGEAVDMGIHPKDWAHDTEGIVSLTSSDEISNEAKFHRHIMNRALEAVDFVNYPTEFWHWSYGDRYWAYHKGAANALYGSWEG